MQIIFEVDKTNDTTWCGAHQLELRGLTVRRVGNESRWNENEAVDRHQKKCGTAAHGGIVVSELWLAVYAVQDHTPRSFARKNFAELP